MKVYLKFSCFRETSELKEEGWISDKILFDKFKLRKQTKDSKFETEDIEFVDISSSVSEDRFVNPRVFKSLFP
jgi:hypothetical protein